MPEALSLQVFTHASWSERRADSYERLAFLGDSVLSLAVTTHLWTRTSLEPQMAEPQGAGRLTKIRAQAVSGRACRAVAERLGVPERLRAVAPPASGGGTGGQAADELVRSERVLASIVEAAIGACYLEYGYERTAAAVVEAFKPEIADALEHSLDFKSALQERLAQRGEAVEYELLEQAGPAHDRRFTLVAQVQGSELGRGSGRSKQEAEQEAARLALERLDG
ncbi:MAG TPA: putative dsRNA-binding protein [Solirubrobacteraceae bacterium]|nr:putative dsRNA-binding protein [Solirubrobacteraceae bacterium]